MGFFLGEGMCWHSSTTFGFCNDVKHVGPRWMLVYFSLYFFVISIFISSPLTSLTCY